MGAFCAQKEGKTVAKYTEWITEEGMLLIGGWARDGLSEKQIAGNAGVSYSTFREWKNKFPALSAVLKKSKDVADREVENALHKKAVGFEYTEVTSERIVDTGQKKRHGGESELTEEEWEFCQRYFNRECAYCGSGGTLSKDHLDPLKNGGTLTFSNVVPACTSCNSSKKDNNWLSWYQSREFYDQYKASKISEFIKFATGHFENSRSLGKLVVTKEVTKYYPPDTGAAAFWLKNRKPETWRDKKETELSGGLDMRNQYKEMSDDELQELVKRYEKINDS